MPTAPSLIEVAFRASDFSSFARKALENVPIEASVILPTFNKCLELDRIGQSPQGHLWIAIYSRIGSVALVLSCTDGYMGAYPVFIVNTNPIDDNDFASCINSSALTLHRHVPVQRVYSVFGPIKIAQHFSRMWTELTGVQAEAHPYYDAKISCLQRRENLQQPVTSENSKFKFEVGPATPADILPIAKSCGAFASDSPPFTLSEEAAFIEARTLVSNRQVWTHKVNGRVVSIAAFTRNTRQVATITKVHTDPGYRGLGCAERLVRQLCNSLLQDRGREAVVLFVGCENRAARVYRRVGFQGLDSIVDGTAVDNVNRWLEVGFDRKKVTLGHW